MQDCETALRVTRVKKGHQISTSKCQLGQSKVNKAVQNHQGLQGDSKVSKVSPRSARSVQGSVKSIQGQQGQSKVSNSQQKSAMVTISTMCTDGGRDGQTWSSIELLRAAKISILPKQMAEQLAVEVNIKMLNTDKHSSFISFGLTLI